MLLLLRPPLPSLFAGFLGLATSLGTAEKEHIRLLGLAWGPEPTAKAPLAQTSLGPAQRARQRASGPSAPPTFGGPSPPKRMPSAQEEQVGQEKEFRVGGH